MHTMYTNLLGCPDCLQVCNSELKKKLRVLFPNCQQKVLDEVLPVEDGMSFTLMSCNICPMLCSCIYLWCTYLSKYTRQCLLYVVPTVRPGYAVHLIQTRWRAFVRKRNETIQLFQGKERRSLIVSNDFYSLRNWCNLVYCAGWISQAA